MGTVSRTAGAAGTITLTIKNSSGSLITPVSTPVVAWYTDTGRTAGVLTLPVTGSGSSYTATWTGAQAPATAATRYLKVTIETATGVFSVDADDDVSFLAAGSSIAATDYTTLTLVKAGLGITTSAEDTAISAAITAASRAIDQYTGTTFYPVTETRLFAVNNCYQVWTDRFTSIGGLVLSTGTLGTYTTTIAAANYVLWPLNAPNRALAYERIDVPTGLLYTDVNGRPSASILAPWGWHYIPEAVEEATRIKAAALFRRKDSPEGFLGTSEFGLARISRSEDPEVARLLYPYTQAGIA